MKSLLILLAFLALSAAVVHAADKDSRLPNIFVFISEFRKLIIGEAKG